MLFGQARKACHVDFNSHTHFYPLQLFYIPHFIPPYHPRSDTT